MGRTKNVPKRDAGFTVTERRDLSTAHERGVSVPQNVSTADASQRQEKRVTFAPLLEQIIPCQELQLEEQPTNEEPTEEPRAPVEVSIEGTNSDEETIQWTLKVRSLDEKQKSVGGSRGWLLQRYCLNSTKLMVVANSDGEDEDEGVAMEDTDLCINTLQGVTCLLQHCESRCGVNDEANDTSSDDQKWESLASAVQDDTMALTCRKKSRTNHEQNETLEISLWLTGRAFEVSCPAYVPITSRRSKLSKKQNVNRNLQMALAALFPQSVLADVVKPPAKSDQGGITAKMIYDVTDNVQLLERYKEDCKEMRKIPGLVPKLRPYQEEAVKWMLEREQRAYTTRGSPKPVDSDNYGREWEVAWIVLTNPETIEATQINGCAKQVGLATPLYQWDASKKNEANVILCCPFAGWLATSYQEARTFSIQTVLPSWNSETDPQPCISGGILADSMGLGKTVEVLACILANPRNPEKKHVVRRLDFVSASETDDEEKKQEEESTVVDMLEDRDLGTVCGEPATAPMDFEPGINEEKEESAETSVSLAPTCTAPIGENTVNHTAKRPRRDTFTTPPRGGQRNEEWQNATDCPAPEDTATRMIMPDNPHVVNYEQNGETRSSETFECNLDDCHVCKKHRGGFLRCSRCPRSFHFECIGRRGLVRRDWVCHVCTEEWTGLTDDLVDGNVSLDTMCTAYAKFNASAEFRANMQVLSMIHEMLATLMDHEFGVFFRHPVDCDETPGYTDLIGQPMDLGTIGRRLISGDYGKYFAENGSWDDLFGSIFEDLELVWHNCFVFCGEGSVVCRAAQVLRQRSAMIQKRSFDHLLSKRVKQRIKLYVSTCAKRRKEVGKDPLTSKQARLRPSRWESLGECLCGGSLTSKNLLSVVVCRTCLEPMHGVCAGFDSEEQLRMETEVTAMVNSNNGDDYLLRVCNDDRCPCCVAANCGVLSEKRNLIQSRATLIVTPPSILNQWEREIRRHTAISIREPVSQGNFCSAEIPPPHGTSTSRRPLKVVVYPGVRELCQNYDAISRSRSSKGTPNHRAGIHLIHPRFLADADVVLMAFNALMGDLGHSPDNPYVGNSSDTSSRGDRRLRKRKRFRVIPSPLSSIKWWRVCLDEAQRVEAPTAASAKMALKLESHHRWCISGTPVSKGKLEDLYGLLLFLGVVPFSSKQMFTKCLQLSHREVMERVKHLLKTLFWRSTKACGRVKNEIGIPQQEEKKVVLRFSSIERHFYERQLEETLLIANDMVASKKNSKASQSDLLALHLHRLRAACCHPQVGSRGIGRRKIKRKIAVVQSDNGYGSVSTSSGILTMDQILDRLIDDAKTKCEEAQRLAVMHTNALACLSKLKVDATKFGCTFQDSDESLLTQSCESYIESLELTESNAQPIIVVGEASLSGCQGFRSARKVVRNGRAKLDWQIKTHDETLGPASNSSTSSIREVWARFDFEGPSKKVVKIMIRPVHGVPSALIEESRASDLVWQLLQPKDCILQVSSSSVGGEFVDVVAFTLSEAKSEVVEDQTWETFGGFCSHKSKSWRVVVKNYYCTDSVLPRSLSLKAYFVGVEVQLMEADIAIDLLQRLHILHNASLSFASLLRQRECSVDIAKNSRPEECSMSNMYIKEKLHWMNDQSKKHESLYMDAARTIHKQSQKQLRKAFEAREQLENELGYISHRVKASRTKSNTSGKGVWDDGWWNDLLSICCLRATQSEVISLIETVAAELEDFYENTVAGEINKKRFPPFHDARGLRVALNMYTEEALSHSGSRSHTPCVESVMKLSPRPTVTEILENSHCGECRRDWKQTGPKCRHCKLDEKLKKLEVDPLLMRVLSALWSWTSSVRSSGPIGSATTAARIGERAKKFFDTVKAAEKERLVARVAWRTHFDLLSDIDELNQCKQTMRLAFEGEDLTKLTVEEKNFVVPPCDIAASCIEHSAKQAMALANLRRHKDTLRYLKNQNLERAEELKRKERHQNANLGTNDKEKTASCIVCLTQFEGERAVLACGHSFHYSPCLENLMRRSGNHNTVSCPMRCTLRTKRDNIMIATDKRKDDGSRCTREVRGSWGTKVTRLVGDVMDVFDLGEKCIVFSQWEDMLDVVEHALGENNVRYVRAKSLTHIADSLRHFRSTNCSALLLNVKNGAEGLTLVEATHVFMVEPLLNCGLDSQAISRIHRIGQACKTYVHRYLVEDTIEIKIDKMRMDRQEDQLEDAIHDTKKKHAISAGGIDGGFSQAELEDVLR